MVNRFAAQYELSNDWMPLRPDMTEVAAAAGMEIVTISQSYLGMPYVDLIGRDDSIPCQVMDMATSEWRSGWLNPLTGEVDP